MSRGRKDTWSVAEREAVRLDFEAGMSEREIVEKHGKSVGQIRGKAIRFQWHKPVSGRAKELRPDVPAVVESRTLFPRQVRAAADAVELLVTGRYQRKLGGRVTKGAWSGMPIFSLTLEERATCPRSCHHWLTCMGNTMQWAVRFREGYELERALHGELARLQALHPRGFVVRLHVLGDFYSTGYVNRWAGWLREFPALHVFGYTARGPETPIGAAVARLADSQWDRFAIRLSAQEAGPGRAITLFAPDFVQLDSSEKIILCPAQENQTAGCGTCGLCWSASARDATIAFTAHGGR